MVTARSPFGVQRSRPSASPFCALWLAVLLLGLMYTHALSAWSVVGHGPANAATAMAVAHFPSGGGEMSVPAADARVDTVRPAERHHDRELPHPAGECVSGQPQQGPAVAAPCPAPLDRAPTASALTGNGAGRALPASGAFSPGNAEQAAVLRI
ncbi:hypothetical protein ACH4OW_11170 [Streptomyces sp. NPDC017056]|uniref:hypothetical protein n=1 Tax=Streptomyces sp. NPDC017056 TaxID=3364973 RepID=UPI0037AF54F0